MQAQANFDLALSSWLLGLELIEGGVLAAADDPTDEVSADVVDRGMLELAVGDRAYEASVAELLALEDAADVDVPSYPVVVFRPSSGTEGLVTAARTSTGLVLRGDLAVSTVSFEPRALDQTDAGVGIIPFTEILIVNLTVTNQGNQPAGGINLRVALMSDRTGTGDTESRSLDRLEAAESTSLEFVFEVLPVVNYELVINLDPLPGEFNTENNVLIVPFMINEAG